MQPSARGRLHALRLMPAVRRPRILRTIIVDHRKSIVRHTYDHLADPWGHARRTGKVSVRETTWIERFLATLPNGAAILDLGCGSGAPILVNILTHGHQVVGVDFSREQLLRTRLRCPQALLIEADIGDVEFVAESFQGIIAYDSLWHLPRDEHSPVFAGIRRWLVRGGTVLLTLAVADGELFTDLMGAPVFYDAWPAARSLAMVQAAGFSVVGQDFQPVQEGRAEGHLIVLAEAT